MREEGGHHPRIERLAGLLLEQRQRRVVLHGPVVRPVGGEGVEVVDHREDARAERDLVALEPLRVALAVPALVVAQNERRHRVRERHRADDLGADLGVDADLLELLLRQRSRLRQDVLGHGQLADIVEQGRRLHALDLVVGHAQRPGDAGGVDLHAADVALGGLVLGVDGQRQRFDRGQVQVRHLLHVSPLVLDASQVDLVGAVSEVQRGEDEEREPRPLLQHRPAGAEGRRRPDEVTRRTPQEVLVPRLHPRLARRERDRHRDEHRVEEEVGGCRPDQRAGLDGDRRVEHPRLSAEPQVDPARRLHGDRQARHAEERAIGRGRLAHAEGALAPGAGHRDGGRLRRAEQQQRGEVHRVGHRHRRAAGRERQRHLERRRHAREHEQGDEQVRIVEADLEYGVGQQGRAQRHGGDDVSPGGQGEVAHAGRAARR